MIFKTFNNDIDKWTAKIGIFGKSFNELGTAIKNALWTSRNEVNNFGEEISFWDALKNNLLPKKEDITSQLIDVMPEINTDNLVDATEKIKNLSKDVANGTTTWQELFDTLPEGQKHFAQLGQQMEGQIITTEGVAKANQSARDAAIAHNAALKQQTLGAKAATVAMKALSIAGNMLLMWGISKIAEGIEYLTSANERYIESQQEIVDKTKEQIAEYDEEINSLTDLQEKLEDARGNKEKLAELQKDLNKAIGETPGLLNLEAEAYDLANQKIEARIEAYKKLKEQETNSLVDAQKNIYNAATVTNDWAPDGKLQDNFSEPIEELYKKYIEELNTQSKIFELSGQGLNIDEISKELNIHPFKIQLTLDKENLDFTFAEYLSEVQNFSSNNPIGAMYGILSQLETKNIQEFFNSQISQLRDSMNPYIESLDIEMLGDAELYSILDEFAIQFPHDMDKTKESFMDFVSAYEESDIVELYNEFFESLNNDDINSDEIYQKLKASIKDFKNEFPQVRNIFDTIFDIDNISKKSRTVEQELKSFTEAFNAESFADSAKALKELAISGQITPEVLTSTKEYRQLLEDTGLTAEEAAEKIREIALGESSLSDIMGSMQSHAKLLNTIAEELEENGELSFETLKSIASQYPQLEKYVTNYLNGVAGAEEELIAELNKQYSADLDNYKDYYTIKQQNDETWFSNYLANTSTWVNELAKQYDIDLQNYGTYLKAKEELEGKLTKAKQIKENLEKRASKLSNNKSFNQGLNGLLGGTFTKFGNFETNFVNDTLSSTEQYINDLEKMLNDMISQFESSSININYGDISDKFKSSSYVGSKSSSSSKTDNTDYWKKEFDDQLATLKHQLAMNQITEAQYYNTLDNFNKKYFANRKEYLSEYRQYEEEVYKGLLSVQKDSLDAINDIIDLRKEMIKDMKEDEIDALEDMIKAEKEKLNAINKSIDARKKAIELLKDEKDHDEEMAEKNKAISDIQVQLDRLALDNSASAQKKKRKLEEELAEKKKDLADYITDYEYDKAMESLDDEADIAEQEYEQLEENLNNQIDAIETYLNDEKQLLIDATNDINGMNETLFTNMKNWAYETTGSVQEVVEKWKEAQKALELYNATNNVPTIKTTLEESNYENKVVNNSGGTNTPSTSSVITTSSPIISAVGGALSVLDNNKSTSGKKDGKALLDEILINKKESYKINLNPNNLVDRLKLKDKDSSFSARSMYWSKIFGGTYTGSGSQNTKLLNYLKSNGYKSGTKKSDKEWAWTQEGGGELIRTKDGAILTPLDNSMVFNNEASMRLWEFSQDPSNFIKGLDLSNTVSSSLANMKITPNQPVVNIGDININGDMGNLTKSDLNEFRKGIVNDVYESMQKNRVKSGRY